MLIFIISTLTLNPYQLTWTENALNNNKAIIKQQQYLTMAQRKPNPSRFQVYQQLSDGSGFTIKGSDHVFKFDKYGGWFDQYKNYYDENGSPRTPPSSQPEDHSDHSDSHHSHHSYREDQDEFEREFGAPGQFVEDDLSEHDINEEKIAEHLETLTTYPVGLPLRINFRNLPYQSRKGDIFNHYKAKVPGLLNVIFSQNQKGLFNGCGHFVVNSVKAAEELVKFEGEAFGQREIHFILDEVEVVVQDPVRPDELQFNFTNQPKVYFNKSLQNNKPVEKEQTKVKVEEKKQVKKEQPKKEVKPIEVKKEEPKVDNKQESFFSYKFEKKAFPLKSDFKQWIQQNGFNHEADVQKVEKINDIFASITMKRKIYTALNNKKFKDAIIVFEQL